MRRLHRQEEGIVSMLAVIFVSILLTIITLGILRQTVDEQRLATDLSLSTKAFYAAEAGIEDALYILTTGSLGVDNDCDESGDLQSEVEAGVSAYTCRLVEAGGDTFEGQIPPSDAFQLSLADADASNPFSILGFSWFNRGEDEPPNLGDGSTNVSYYPNNPSDKQPNVLPMLRAELIRYPRSGAFNRDFIEQAVLFLRPADSADEDIAPVFSHYGSGATVVNVNCPNSIASGYICNLDLINLNSDQYNYTLRLSALYNDSFVSFRMQTRNGVGPVANNLQTIVDVTARANDIYRRVRYRLPNQAGGITPQFAIVSDGDICKDPEVSISSGAVTAGGDDACTLTSPDPSP